jgi:hypothetical protein
MENTHSMEYYVGDGYLEVIETLNCKYEVAFRNYVGLPTLDTMEHETLFITFERRQGSLPDTVIILDSVSNILYQMVVEDGTTGRTCIPWPLVG